VVGGRVNALAILPALFQAALGVTVPPAATPDAFWGNVITALMAHVAAHGVTENRVADRPDDFEVPALLRLQAEERARAAHSRGPSTPASRGGVATTAE
jgi:hypothetical protein